MEKPATWTATVDWLREPDRDPSELGAIMDALAEHSPAIGKHVSPTSGTTDIWSATVTLEEPTLRAATSAALRVVEVAVGAKAIGVEVLSTAEFERRAEEPTIPDLVGFAEIAEIARVTRQRARQFAAIAGFPPAVVVTQTGPLRVRASVLRWLEHRGERKPGRPRKERAEK